MAEKKPGNKKKDVMVPVEEVSAVYAEEAVVDRLDNAVSGSDVYQAIAEAAKITPGFSPEVLEALKLVATNVEPISKAAEKMTASHSTALAELAKTSSTILEKVDTRGLTNAMGQFVGMAHPISDGLQKSIGQKEFEEVFAVQVPKTLKEHSECIKRVERIDEALTEIEKNGSYRSSNMDLGEGFIAELKMRRQALSGYNRDFRKKHMTFDSSLVERNIDYLLEKHGITRNDLERILGVGQSYFNRAFNQGDERRRVSIDVMCQVCSCFNISIERFLTEDLRMTSQIGEPKTRIFLDSLISGTKDRVIRWEAYREGKVKSQTVNKEISYSLSFSDCGNWAKMSKLEGKTIFFLFTASRDSDENVHEDYKIGVEKDGELNWLFGTASDNHQNLRHLCSQLDEVIAAFETAGFVSAEAEEVMDDIVSAIERNRPPF